MALKCTSVKPGNVEGVGEQEGGCTAAYRTARGPQAFPKHRCLLRQSEASHSQTSPLVQYSWDPRPDTIRCRVAPGLQNAPNVGQRRSRRWEEDLGVAAGWSELRL